MTEDQAFEVEAALIDAYPEVTNQLGGKASDDRGLTHARQVIERYEAPEATFEHRAMLININRTASARRSVYEAVRWAWRINRQRAANAEVILTDLHGLIVGAFVAETWLPATVRNFPDIPADVPGRWGFVGRDAPPEVVRLYLRRRVPDAMRGQQPVRYTFPRKIRSP